MDFGSFSLQENEELFKQNYQLNQNNNDNSNNEQQPVDESTDFFNFMNNDSTYNSHSNNHNNANAHTHQSTFTVPQLSPDGHEDSFTNSSVLSGHNPEFNMSPLQIASQPNNSNINSSNSMIQSYHTPVQHANQSNPLEDFADEEVRAEETGSGYILTYIFLIGILYTIGFASYGAYL
jgi:hypothetical protein